MSYAKSARTGSRTWPANFESIRDGRSCSMCEAGRPDDDGHGLRVFEGDVVDAYLQRRAELPGWTTSIWRGRHVAEPMDLSADDAGTYWVETLKVASVLREYFDPIKVNLNVLGNAIPHLHTHITLRYADDRWPSQPAQPGTYSSVYSPDEFARHVARLRELLA